MEKVKITFADGKTADVFKGEAEALAKAGKLKKEDKIKESSK